MTPETDRSAAVAMCPHDWPVHDIGEPGRPELGCYCNDHWEPLPSAAIHPEREEAGLRAALEWIAENYPCGALGHDCAHNRAVAALAAPDRPLHETFDVGRYGPKEPDRPTAEGLDAAELADIRERDAEALGSHKRGEIVAMPSEWDRRALLAHLDSLDRPRPGALLPASLAAEYARLSAKDDSAAGGGT